MTKKKVSKDFENGFILGVKSALLTVIDDYSFDYYSIAEEMLEVFQEQYLAEGGDDKVYDEIIVKSDNSKLEI